MRPSIHIAIASVATIFWSIPAPAQTNVEDAPDPYIQQQTGMSFPLQIGNFRRHQVFRYSEDGSDTGVGYDLNIDKQKRAFVSMFVYPAVERPAAQRSSACAELHEGMKRDILAHEPKAHLVARDEVPSPSGFFKLPGLRAIYSGASINFAGTVQPVHEEALLFCFAGQKWLVSYRITWPEKYAESARPEVAKLLQALQWPETLARAD